MFWRYWRIAKYFRERRNFLALCGLLPTLALLAVLRSNGWSLNETVNDGLPTWIACLGYGMLLVIGIFFVWVVQAPQRANYFLGFSLVLGVFPEIPKLPFLRDFTHAALILFVIANWRCLYLSLQVRPLADPRNKSYVAFLISAVVSVVMNYLLRGDVWQLKIGLSGLLILGFVLMALYVIYVSPGPQMFIQLYKGFLDSAQIAAALGVVGIYALFVMPYSAGSSGDGQNTLWGLGYFDRLILFFDGPAVTATYFVMAMSFAIHSLSDYAGTLKHFSRPGLIFLVQISPWLVAATGSRVGRIALVVLVVSGLLWKPVRRKTLIALPSSLAAVLMTLDFQSFPSAFKYFIGNIYLGAFDIQSLEKMRLVGRFFKPEQRGDHWREALLAIKDYPLINKLFGMGYGVSGYSSSPYPTAHNEILGMIIGIGFVGFIAFVFFWLVCSWFVFFTVRRSQNFELSVQWAFFVSLISICGLAVAYPITTKGLVLVFVLLMFSWPVPRTYKSRD